MGTLDWRAIIVAAILLAAGVILLIFSDNVELGTILVTTAVAGLGGHAIPNPVKEPDA